jgi:multidrug efflux pump subunit AcrB
MKLIILALRHPISVLIVIAAIAMAFAAAVGKPVVEQLGVQYPKALPRGMEVDVFPALNLPVIYVCQPYGGMDPRQMEGFLTNYYEYHFLYISGIDHVESRNIQGTALMKLYFHPGTNMAQAMAETINYVNRSQAFMPPGTVSPFVMRFDTGSVPVGRLVLSSDTKTIAQIQDLALFRVRPMFARLPGVSAPPPFGGSIRSIVVSVDPERLQAYGMSPEEIVAAIGASNRLTPSGNMPLGDKFPVVEVNSVVRDVQSLLKVPIRSGKDKTVYLRDVGSVADFMDAPTGYALVNGRRAVYILATKRADASTLSVVNEIKKALPRMQDALGEEGKDIKVSFEFDQTPYVTRGVSGVVLEGLLGAVLVGLMILLFLRDWRSSLVVVLNIPLALMVAVLALWLFGQTLNLMTLGGLALAIGILVDEATVEVENIHAQMFAGHSVARAVRLGNAQTAKPRFLAMVCVLAVFLSAFFMQGAARGLFVPLSLAVGFAMIASYILSSTFVPVIAVWLLRHHQHTESDPDARSVRVAGLFDRLRGGYESVARRMIGGRWIVVGAYFVFTAVSIGIIAYRAFSVGMIASVAGLLGMDIFPQVGAESFQLRLRAEDGTHVGLTEEVTKQTMELIADEIGEENVNIQLGYVGTIPASFPINAVFHWSHGPEEATMWVELKRGHGLDPKEVQERLRGRLAKKFPKVRFSFEPADIINQVMSFGSPTPVEVSVRGANLQNNVAFAEKVRKELAAVPTLQDVQFGQSLDYPTIRIDVDREKAGLAGVTPTDIAYSLVPATSSSRFTTPIFWAEPKSGIGYQIQVEVPRKILRDPKDMTPISTIEDLRAMPVAPNRTGGAKDDVRLRDVAEITEGKMPGQIDRYNMQREITVTANIAGADLGTVSRQVNAALQRVGDPPAGVEVEVRGQIPPLESILKGLGVGLLVSIAIIFLLLAANFQSFKLAFVTVSTVPAVIAGVVLTLLLTGTTLNIQSFIGTIMAVGIAMANAILLVTFAEERRRGGEAVLEAAVGGAEARLRAVLMTSAAMIAGMLPMALGLGEAGQQNAPLARAVVGGLLVATFATLFLLPSVFAIVQSRAKVAAASLDPDDPSSPQYDGDA